MGDVGRREGERVTGGGGGGRRGALVGLGGGNSRGDGEGGLQGKR